MIDKNTRTNSILSFFYVNAIAFLLVFFATFINGKPIPFIGNMVWLQVGVILLMYLLLTYRVFIGCLLGVQLSASLLWGWELISFSNAGIILISSISPLISISIMKFFKLSNFFEKDKLVFQHLIFLAIFTALCNTLLKFIAYSYFESDPYDLSFSALLFIERYFVGDVLGTLTVLLIAAYVFVPSIRYFFPEVVPLE